MIAHLKSAHNYIFSESNAKKFKSDSSISKLYHEFICAWEVLFSDRSTIAATSTQNERVFSISGNFVTPHRNTISHELLDNIVFF